MLKSGFLFSVDFGGFREIQAAFNPDDVLTLAERKFSNVAPKSDVLFVTSEPEMVKCLQDIRCFMQLSDDVDSKTFSAEGKGSVLQRKIGVFPSITLAQLHS